MAEADVVAPAAVVISPGRPGVVSVVTVVVASDDAVVVVFRRSWHSVRLKRTAIHRTMRMPFVVIEVMGEEGE